MSFQIASIVAERLINPSITAFLQLPDDYEIAEIKAPKKILNRTLEDIKLLEKYNLTLITLKRQFEEETNDGEVEFKEHILGVLKEETVIYDTDTLVVFGTLNNVKRFLEINQQHLSNHCNETIFRYPFRNATKFVGEIAVVDGVDVNL